jgi:hypothetical protein
MPDRPLPMFTSTSCRGGMTVFPTEFQKYIGVNLILVLTSRKNLKEKMLPGTRKIEITRVMKPVL